MWGERSFADATDVNEAAEAPAETENPWAVRGGDAGGEVVESPKPKAEPTSFIERYSHMFADEAASEAPKPVEPTKPLIADSLNSNPRAMGVVRDEARAGTARPKRG